MDSEFLSLADYIHAVGVVLARLPAWHRDPRVAAACAEAARVLQQVDAARRRLGIGGFDPGELERVSGLRLPARVTAWLAECARGLASGEGVSQAERLLNLCRAFQWMLLVPERITVGAHLLITDLADAENTAMTPQGVLVGRFSAFPRPVAPAGVSAWRTGQPKSLVAAHHPERPRLLRRAGETPAESTYIPCFSIT